MTTRTYQTDITIMSMSAARKAAHVIDQSAQLETLDGEYVVSLHDGDTCTGVWDNPTDAWRDALAVLTAH